MKEKAEKTKNQAKDILYFLKFTGQLLFCLSIKACAVMGTYYAIKLVHHDIALFLILICTANTFLAGICQLYKVVMKKNA